MSNFSSKIPRGFPRLWRLYLFVGVAFGFLAPRTSWIGSSEFGSSSLHSGWLVGLKIWGWISKMLWLWDQGTPNEPHQATSTMYNYITFIMFVKFIQNHSHGFSEKTPGFIPAPCRFWSRPWSSLELLEMEMQAAAFDCRRCDTSLDVRIFGGWLDDDGFHCGLPVLTNITMENGNL